VNCNVLFQSQTRSLTAKCSQSANLKLRQHSLSTTNGYLTARLLLCISDLAVIDDHRVPRSAHALSPAELLGECRVRVGEEELLCVMSTSIYHINYKIYKNRKWSWMPGIGGREKGRGLKVGNEKGRAYDRIILNTIRLPPRTHDVRIVVRDHGDDIDALAF
jgi:hypothetical protein